MAECPVSATAGFRYLQDMNGNKKDKMLVNRICRMERFPGKGGWTYVLLPEIPPDPHAHFGWVRVKGSIDGIPISQYHLMPSGNGQLFLPVKAAIRKKLGKSAGDEIRVILFPDNSPVALPGDIRECLADEPAALEAFDRLSPAEQKKQLDYIRAAVKEETKAERIAGLIRLLMR